MNDSDSPRTLHDLSETFASSDSSSAQSGALQDLDQIGRYRIDETLGTGGYGIVYLAFDEKLKRQVAVKVPYPNHVSRPQSAAAYLKEARTVASLDHPNIVPVYDVGATEECPCFIVSKYIKGSTLAVRMEQDRLSFQHSAHLMATLADALDHAHRQGLVHRDIKPGNILLDEEGTPWLADFGLALREQDVGYGKRFVGTAYYMSPEQARGEGHRVDTRSDIFSLGSVLYELLAGKRPFSGDSRQEVLERIVREDAPPLWHVDRSVNRELARICHKAMARRVNERYSSASELSQDLRSCQPELANAGPPDSDSNSTPLLQGESTRQVSQGTASSQGSSDANASWGTRPAVQLVPKGLRAFDAQDADFYLDLLPGPRDRDGLPGCIRFWKYRIEQLDPDQAFSVGVIYGPSGCGKSSLVKAGLLPRLSDDVCQVYVEATASGTESRLLHLIRKKIPDANREAGLKETLAEVRRGSALQERKKLLIVIDQFEQWLHVHHDLESTELLGALRQCDGGHVQCIVLVRDEFWLAVSRFARALEFSLTEGENCALVDLFDLTHAEKVLSAFGIAYGRLPELALQMSEDQKQFVKRAVADLADDGRVRCIQLSLLADMLKSKPWTQEALRDAGGAMGVGEIFLEQTFSDSAAPPAHRYHQSAARAVLKSLLPDDGASIKGQMKSREELRQLCGYASRQQDFEELIKILDTDLRLISPVDSLGVTSRSSNQPSSPVVGEYYQLTHDYLVPSLWQWLTHKQCESRRGRAEVRLAERSALWNAKPEARQLPSFLEFANIRLFTHSRQWTPQERSLLGSAGRYHLAHKGVLLLLLLTVGFAGWRFLGSIQKNQAQIEQELLEQSAVNQAVAMVQQLRDADIGSVAQIAADLEAWRPYSDRIIIDGFQHAAVDSPQKLHLAIALMPIDQAGVDYVASSLADLKGQQFEVALETLQAHKAIACETLWHLSREHRLDKQRLLLTAVALASMSPRDTRWDQLAPEVSAQLTQLIDPGNYLERLRPVAPRLVVPLKEMLDDRSLPHAERWRAATALCSILSVDQQIADSLPDVLVEWILETTDANEFHSLLAALRPHSYGVQRQVKALLEAPTNGVVSSKRMNAAAVLLQLGESDLVWPLLQYDPDPTSRSRLIDRLAQLEISKQVIAEQLADQEDAGVRQAIVITLGSSKPPAAGQKVRLTERLAELYREDPDAGIHAAIAWTLRRWQLGDELASLNQQLSRRDESKTEHNRAWTVNSLGQTYIRIAPPGEFLIGDASGGQRLRPARIDYRFAIAAEEVTVAQFKLFRRQHAHDAEYAPNEECPVNNVSWYDAVAFCNWLSNREGLTPCYEPNATSEYADGVRIPEDLLRRNGYRLPTEFELEYLIRGGTLTAYSFGEATDRLGEYAWYETNARNRTWPVGGKRPNAFGAFDTHGNLWEWSQDLQRVSDRADDRMAVDQKARLLCGGAFDNPSSRVESGDRLVHFPHEYKFSYGFRPARTLTSDTTLEASEGPGAESQP